MTKIILKITPVDSYSFGSENRRPDNKVNYFLKSLPIPQQSTMLGAMRYMFLKFVADDKIFKDNKIKDKIEAGKLIGEKSFDIEGTNFDMGKIESISEVFLLQDKTPYLPAPMDSGFAEITFIGVSKIPNIPDYSAKAHYPKTFTMGDDIVKFDRIFREVIQSGNKKDNKGDDDDDAYYKRQYYRLDKDWAFGIELSGNDTCLGKFDKPIFMNMGGENKLFRIEKLEGVSLDRNAILHKHAHSHYIKVVLTSDAYVVGDPYKNCLFAFSKTKPFRNLKSSVEITLKYQNRSKNSDSMQQSSLFELIESGSVFYFETSEEAGKFEQQIFNNYLDKAGMNKYVLLETKS